MKKTLGIIPSASDMTMQIIEGDKTDHTVIKLEKEVLKFPDTSQTEKILEINNFTKAIIAENKIEEIYLLKAGASPIGKGASSDRIKAEAAIQLAAAEQGIPITLISPLTLTAEKKKAEKKAEPSLDDSLNHKFSSNAKRDAALLSIMQLKKGK